MSTFKIDNMPKNEWKNSNFVRIENYPEGMNWFFPKRGALGKFFAGTVKVKEEIKRSVVLTKDNRKEMQDIFGPPNFCYKGEFYYRIYLLRFQGFLFSVATAKDKGTEIAILDRKENTNIIPNFLNAFYEKIKQ